MKRFDRQVFWLIPVGLRLLADEAMALCSRHFSEWDLQQRVLSRILTVFPLSFSDTRVLQTKMPLKPIGCKITAFLVTVNEK